MTAAAANVVTAGGVELDMDAFVVTANGVAKVLCLQEAKLLRLLMENAGHVLSRRDLLDSCWGQGYSDQNKTLEVHISRLRKKIESTGCEAPIRTVRSVGYIFDRTAASPKPYARR